jgi:hypothetical protein
MLLQVKCPECRAEHRIPYQGVQGFPTNVTLQRFLELHIEITGELPDPTSGQIMERCNVCSEKSYCALCVHCEKKICTDCKEAHMDILRREISRINNQVFYTSPGDASVTLIHFLIHFYIYGITLYSHVFLKIKSQTFRCLEFLYYSALCKIA